MSHVDEKSTGTFALHTLFIHINYYCKQNNLFETFSLGVKFLVRFSVSLKEKDQSNLISFNLHIVIIMQI